MWMLQGAWGWHRLIRLVSSALSERSILLASKNTDSITSGQIRAARALLRWTAADLANSCQVGIATVKRAELQEGVVRLTAPNVAAIRRALESAGIEFIAENGGGAGVRMREPGP